MNTNIFLSLIVAPILCGGLASADAQQPAAGPASPTVTTPSFAIPAANNSYADVADLVVAAPVIVDVMIRKTTNVSAQQAIGVPTTLQRTVVEADVMTLLRGTQGMPGTVRFLVDVPRTPKGKLPKLKKQRFFLFGSQVAGSPGTIKLSRPDALAEWSPANDAMVRAITREAVQIDAPKAITGVSSAFFSAGSVIGEGNSQIFLNSADGPPYAISVTSKAGGKKSWTISTSDLIEETASAPKTNSLLWYRLACGLPASLPLQQLEDKDQQTIDNIRSDYAYVQKSLGRCDRTRR
jgi:hypothetical protein